MATIDQTSPGIAVRTDRSTTLPVSRWMLLSLLLAIEALAFTLRFDTQSLLQADGILARALDNAPLVCQFILTTAVVALVFGGNRLKEIGCHLSPHFVTLPKPYLPLFIHFVLLAAFYRLSILVFDDVVFVTAYSFAGVGLWLAVGVLSIASLCAAGIPITLWWITAYSVLALVVGSMLVAFSALVAGQLAHAYWRPLASGTFWIVENLLRAFYSDVVIHPGEFEVGTSAFTVRIAPGCSGYEGIGLILVFLGAFLAWYRRDLKFPNALLLVPLGVVLIWLANSVRIAALVAIGSSLSPAIAAGGFHSQAGWLAFNAIALGIVAVVWSFPFFSYSAMHDGPRARRVYPAAPFLAPFLILVAATMVTAALAGSAILDQLYPVRVLAVLLALAYFARTYRLQRLFAGGLSWGAIALGVIVSILWLALEPFSGVSEQLGVDQGAVLAGMSSNAAAIWIGFRALGSVIAVPLAEELAFRGFLTRRLIAEEFSAIPLGKFTWISFLVSSVVFGMLHDRWLAGTLAGALFALALYRRGRLIDAVVAHATANSLVTGYVLATGRWAAWS